VDGRAANIPHDGLDDEPVLCTHWPKVGGRMHVASADLMTATSASSSFHPAITHSIPHSSTTTTSKMYSSENVSLCDRCKKIFVKHKAGWVDLFRAATLEDFHPETCSICACIYTSICAYVLASGPNTSDRVLTTRLNGFRVAYTWIRSRDQTGPFSQLHFKVNINGSYQLQRHFNLSVVPKHSELSANLLRRC
jgi:hypothetical protein